MAAGINSTNLLHCLHGSVSLRGLPLDGVAVVSDIVASTDPLSAAWKLSTIVSIFKSSPPPVFSFGSTRYTVESIKNAAGSILASVRKFTPLIHQVRFLHVGIVFDPEATTSSSQQITNNVVVNQSANATIALGASPIMATAPQEMEDLSKVTGGLLINFGTIENIEGMLAAGLASLFFELNEKATHLTLLVI